MAAVPARFRSLIHFVRDRCGVSAVEFALIAPMMIAMYIGIAHLSLVLSADRKVSSAALVVADLTTQQATVTRADLADFLAAGRIMTAPLNGADMGLRVRSVRMCENGTTYVSWSEADAMSAENGVPELPEGLLTPGGSVILVDTEMPLVTSFSDLFGGPVTSRGTAIMRPRRSNEVSLSPALPRARTAGRPPPPYPPRCC
ncbi:pilus assembly protein [Hyphomonadaceae bacterium ML37]|nr:pilus assembly protein [Hyphomonadaceae bacterium ML37]